MTEIEAWLMERALSAQSLGELLEGICQRLVAGGMDVVRGNISLSIVDPLFRSRFCTWTVTGGIETVAIPTSRASTASPGARSPSWRSAARRSALADQSRNRPNLRGDGGGGQAGRDGLSRRSAALPKAPNSAGCAASLSRSPRATRAACPRQTAPGSKRSPMSSHRSSIASRSATSPSPSWTPMSVSLPAAAS